VLYFCLTQFLILIYFLALDRLIVGFDMLKFLRVLTDQFTKLKISHLSGLAGLFVS
jgi:hypothetical protein